MGLPKRMVTVLNGRMNFEFDRLHLDRAHDADRDDGHAALTREAGHAGPALVHVRVERAGPFGVEARGAAPSRAPRSAPSPARARLALPPPRRIGICPAARKNQAVFFESKYSALAKKVTLRRHHQRDEERVAERLVVGGQHGRPLLGDVLPPLHLDPPQHEEDRAEDPLEHPVRHRPNVVPASGAPPQAWRLRRRCDAAMREHPGGPMC